MRQVYPAPCQGPALTWSRFCQNCRSPRPVEQPVTHLSGYKLRPVGRSPEEPNREAAGSPEPRVTAMIEGGGLWAPTVRRFRLQVLESEQAGSSWDSAGDACSIGSEEGNDLRLT